MESKAFLDQVLPYLPQEWREALCHGEELTEKAEGAVLYADISGYTPMAEALARVYGLRQGAEELPKVIDNIYNQLIAEVDRFHGSVIDFSGDAITCWFDDHTKGVEPMASGCWRAAECGLAMQAAMKSINTVNIPGQSPIQAAAKISIATGPVRRLVVGNPAIQRFAVMAGETVFRMAVGERVLAQGIRQLVIRPGAVIADEATSVRLGEHAQWGEARVSEQGERYRVLTGLHVNGSYSPWPELPSSLFDEDSLKPWLHPRVYERLKEGLGEFLPELRPAAALFMHFSGIDYDHDLHAGEKLNQLICLVQAELVRAEAMMIQITIGDKGSYLYAAFGVPQAHEDDACRAVTVALALLDLHTSLDWLIEIQIGISLGTMRTGAYGGRSRRTYGVLGDDVNLAARLMGRAAPGEVLISSRVYKAVSGDAELRSGGFRFEPRVPIQLKGKSEPIPVHAITGAKQKRAVRLQEPSYGLPMVGRQNELARIEDKMDLVLSGRGQIVGISAEAGLGKSRLIAEAIRVSRRKGLIGYGGACQSNGMNTSYLVWAPIWQAIFDINPDAALRRQIRGLEAMLAEWVPARLEALPLLNPLLGITVPENDFTAKLEPRSRRSVLEALLLDCLLALAKDAAAENGGLLLVLEDLHWIDPVSLDLLELFSKASVDMPVLILLAYRPFEPSMTGVVRVEGQPNFTQVKLNELTPVEAEQAVRAKLAQLYPEWRGAIPKYLIERVITEAQGNPFYAEEILNYLHDQDMDLRDSRILEKLEIPTSLHSLILSRIDQLSNHQQLTIKVASIIGRLFRFNDLLGYYPDLGSAESLHGDLNELASHDLTLLDTPEPELAYLFRHIITHEVTYDSLLSSTRTRLHELFARYLEEHNRDDLTPCLDLLAHHYNLSENFPKKLEYLRLAAEAAAARYANEDAIRYLQHAISLIESSAQGEDRNGNPDPYQAQLYEKLGDVFSLIGRYLEAQAVFQQALAQPANKVPLQQAILYRKISLTQENRFLFQEAHNSLDLAEKCLNYSEPGSSMDERQEWWNIQYQRVMQYYWQNRLLEMETLVQRLQAVVTGNTLEQSKLVDLKTSAMVRRERYRLSEDTVNLAKQYMDLAQDLGDLLKITDAWFGVGFSLLWHGAVEEALPPLHEAMALSVRVGDRMIQARSLNYIVVAHRKLGNTEEVRRIIPQLIKICTEIDQQSYLGMAHGNLCWLAWRDRDLESAVREGLISLEFFKKIPTTFTFASLFCWPLLAIAISRGRVKEALEYAQIMMLPDLQALLPQVEAVLTKAIQAWEKADEPSALSFFNQALEEAERAGDL